MAQLCVLEWCARLLVTTDDIDLALRAICTTLLCEQM
jgi:hypothetical protein